MFYSNLSPLWKKLKKYIKKKIKEINVGSKPAGIAIDSINRQVYISNPESGNVTQINVKNFKTQNFKSGSSPLGIFYSENKNILLHQLFMYGFNGN